MDERITHIHRSLLFIEQYLHEDIQVMDIARASGYSLYHFIRLFNQLVHHTPYDYLIRRRLSRAALELMSNRRRVIDIALDSCFQNAETFSRAFQRVFHVQPSQARKKDSLDRRLILQPRTVAHLIHFQQVDLLHPQDVQAPQQFIAGLPCNDELNSRSLDAYTGQLKAYMNAKTSWYWLKTYPTGEKEMGIRKFIGFEISDCRSLPVGLYAKRLPANRYAVFDHTGEMDKMNLTSDYIYQTWLANSNEQSCSPLEIYRFPFQYKNQNIQVWIPLKSKER